jgi:aminomethyltransferase
MNPDHALQVWDALIAAGKGYGIAPAGMVALDIARIEAGLLLIQVDYISSRKALIESQKSSPFELGLGWTVDLGKGPFVGRKALVSERQRGSLWSLVGLEIEWSALESEYARVNLAPQVAGRASRTGVPVYRGNQQIGHATSQAFSPILKRYLALATLESRYAQPGALVEMEISIEYVRKRTRARVMKLPFLVLPRRKTL